MDDSRIFKHSERVSVTQIHLERRCILIVGRLAHWAEGLLINRPLPAGPCVGGHRMSMQMHSGLLGMSEATLIHDSPDGQQFTLCGGLGAK